MNNTKAYAALSADSKLDSFQIQRRIPGAHDVQIDIKFCGVCHSDIHQVRNEWGGSQYPMVPGHEIIGIVTAVGEKVSKFKKGDWAGVGCFVDSCRICENCKDGLEQFCNSGMVGTYNSMERDGKTPTFGGYSEKIVTDENYVIRVSEKLNPARSAPLLCAGITTYSPLKHWKAGPGMKVAVIGLGGLGHMAIKFAVAFGAEVTLISSSPKKEKDAKEFGASGFICSKNEEDLKNAKNQFDLMIDTVSADHPIPTYLNLLRRDGTMVMLGIPPSGLVLSAFNLVGKRRSLAGSLIGGIAETQEMMDFCAEKGIMCDVEVIAASEINEAYERMIKGDVRYRFVIDCATL